MRQALILWCVLSASSLCRAGEMLRTQFDTVPAQYCGDLNVIPDNLFPDKPLTIDDSTTIGEIAPRYVELLGRRFEVALVVEVLDNANHLAIITIETRKEDAGSWIISYSRASVKGKQILSLGVSFLPKGGANVSQKRYDFPLISGKKT